MMTVAHSGPGPPKDSPWAILEIAEPSPIVAFIQNNGYVGLCFECFGSAGSLEGPKL